MSKALLSVLSGLGGMFGWGISDFFANDSAEEIGNFKTFFWSQIVAVIVVLIAVLVMQPILTLTPLLSVLIVLTGIAYAIGYLLFYKGFQIGNVSVVSAVINAQNLFIIGIAFFVLGQRLSQFQIPGLVLILVGVLLVSVNFNDFMKGKVQLLKGVKEALLSALVFGAIYWPVHEFVVERSDWLMVQFLTKIVAIITVCALAYFQKHEIGINPKAGKKINIVVLIVLVGLLEAAANISTSFGLSVGDSILVGPIASCLTLVTVALAVMFRKEKLTRSQAVGVVLTVFGIVLTAM